MLLIFCQQHGLKVFIQPGSRLLEGCDHLVGSCFCQRIKFNIGMGFLEFTAVVFFDFGKHIPVFHMMAINQNVWCRLIHPAVPVYENHSIGGFLFVKIPVDIKFRFVWGIHDRIVHLRAFDTNPSLHIRILAVQSLVLCQSQTILPFLLFRRIEAEYSSVS